MPIPLGRYELPMSRLIKRLFGRTADDEDPGSHYPDLDGEARDMIRGIVQLGGTSVKEVMVPRIDVAFIAIDADGSAVLKSISEYGHSRYPVYRGSSDNVVGVLYAKDLLRYLTVDEPISIESIMRKPYFVPESKRLDSLLREMRGRRVHIAVAVDEYGGVSGIVCLEDIIEEIVGDIQDEYDNEREAILEIGPDTWLCDARVNIGELNSQLETNIPDYDFDTLGGYVFELFGKIPVKYEKISTPDLDFIIQEMDGHKIRTIKIVRRGDGTSGGANAEA